MSSLERSGKDKLGASISEFKGSTAALHEEKKKGANAAALASANLEKRRAMLEPRHTFLLEKFAAVVDEKVSVLENSLLYGNKLEIIADFFAENGPKKLLFFWQAPPKVGFFVRCLSAEPTNQTTKRMFLINLTKQ